MAVHESPTKRKPPAYVWFRFIRSPITYLQFLNFNHHQRSLNKHTPLGVVSAGRIGQLIWQVHLEAKREAVEWQGQVMHNGMRRPLTATLRCKLQLQPTPTKLYFVSIATFARDVIHTPGTPACPAPTTCRMLSTSSVLS